MFSSIITISQFYILLGLVFILTLGLIVFFKNSKSLLSRLFFGVSLICAWWLFGTFMMFGAKSDEETILWDRLIYVGIVFFPALEYHFSLVVTHLSKRRMFFLWTSYILSIFFLVFSQSKYFISGIFKYTWGSHGYAQILHHFFMVFFILYVGAVVYNFAKEYKNFPSKRFLMVYFLVAFSLLNILGSLAYLPAYQIPIYPIFFAAPFIFSILIFYAIITKQLMNLKFTLRKSVVYALALLSVFVPILIWNKFFSLIWPEAVLWFNFIAFALLLPLFSRLKKYYFHIANKYFFSSLYDSRLLVTAVGKTIRSTIDPERIFVGVSDDLRPAFHFKSIGVLYYENEGDFWSIMYNDGFVFSGKKFYLDQEMIVDLFKDRRSPFLAEDNKDPYFESLISFFKTISAEIVVPIFIDNKVSALMFLGAKESGDSYSDIDIEVLEIIADELSISLENGLLYRKLQEFNNQLQKKVEKATEKLRLRNDELKKVNELKNEFISVISHQLKTPLASSKLTLEIMDIKYGKVIDPEAGTMIHSLSMINEQLINMVNELLDVARIQEGRLKVEIQPIDILSLIKKTVMEFQPLADKRKVVIVEDYCEAQMIDFDMHVAEKAVANMMSNGIKYNREGKNLFISLVKEDDGLLYKIRDEGIGIPAKEQGKIFQKFYQASNAAASNFESSTGLGLYIVKSLVEQLGGKVWFESKEGEGTTFFVKFPYKATIAPDKKVEPA